MTIQKFPLYSFTSCFFILFGNKMWTPLAVLRDAAWSVTLGWHTQRYTKLEATTLNGAGREGKENAKLFFSRQPFPVHQQFSRNHFYRNTGRKIWPMTPSSSTVPANCSFFISGILQCWSLLMWNISNIMAIIFSVIEPRTQTPVHLLWEKNCSNEGKVVVRSSTLMLQMHSLVFLIIQWRWCPFITVS